MSIKFVPFQDKECSALKKKKKNTEIVSKILFYVGYFIMHIVIKNKCIYEVRQ